MQRNKQEEKMNHLIFTIILKSFSKYKIKNFKLLQQLKLKLSI